MGLMNPDRDPPQFTESYHEYIHNDIAVCGRLKTCVNYYQQTGANQFVLSVIRHGYTIPFSTEPTPVFLKNNKTARENPEFVRNTIDDLLQAGVIAQRSQPAFVNNPLSVSSKNDKLRMVLDCRHINSFIDTPPVKPRHIHQNANAGRLDDKLRLKVRIPPRSHVSKPKWIFRIRLSGYKWGITVFPLP